MAESRVGLADVMTELRREMREAATKAAKETPHFKVREVEVELQVAVTKKAKAAGGVKFWVYSAEAGGELQKQNTQTIRLKLDAVDEEDKPFKMKGELAPEDVE